MTIAFFNSIESWGGGEKWHFETAKHFAALGHEIYVFGNKHSELQKKCLDFQNLNFTPVATSRFSYLNPFKIRRLQRKFKALKISTVIINNSKDLKTAGVAGYLASMDRIVYRRGSATPIRNTLVNRILFRHVITDVLANSEATKNSILANNENLYPRHKIKVIYNPIKNLSLVKQPNRNSTLTIGAAGRLEYEKNHCFLVDLSVELKKRKIPHTIKIAGTGKLLHKLVTYSKEKNVADTVHFLGFQNDIYAFLQDIDILVHPSLWEGFGYIIAEAAFSSIPTVAFNVGSIPELIVDEKTGYIHTTNDIKGVTDSILLLRDTETRRKTGDNAKQWALQKFEKKTIYKQLESFLLEPK